MTASVIRFALAAASASLASTVSLASMTLLVERLGAADLQVVDAGANVQLSWPVDGAYRVPCWRGGENGGHGEWIPIHVQPRTADGRHVLTVARDPAAREFALLARGADVPFTTVEAEDAPAAGGAELVRMVGTPRGADSTPELEASGRAYVALEKTGSHLDIPLAAAANSIVVRHCIPDAPGGGGTEATLSLYVNGIFRQKLALTSRFAWLYGDDNGQSEDPTKGRPHVYWDEARALIAGAPPRAGDVLRLQKDAGDGAAFYRIDLVDVELVPPPQARPPDGEALSVTAYGAIADDDRDDTAAIQACLDAARERHLAAWLPPGTWRQSAKLRVDGVALRGAGMWYTNVVGTVAGEDWTGRLGFTLAGDRAAVRDLAVTSAVTTNRDVEGGKTFTADSATHWLIENVWITHANVGLWMSGAYDGAVRGCRIRLTYADGINLNRGSSRNVVEGNHIRGCGDDGIALLSETIDAISSDANIVRHNTVRANWWGHNGDFAGGAGNVFEDNLFADDSLMGVFTINLCDAYPMHPVVGGLVRRNSFIRGGGDYAWQNRGAVWIYPSTTTIAGLAFRDNEIRAPMFSGIHLIGSRRQDIVFERNLIDGPGTDAIVIGEQARGSGRFIGNRVVNLPSGRQALVNGRVGEYAVTLDANDW